MSSKRPKPIDNKVYVEINAKILEETGEYVPVSDPIYAPTITSKVPRGKFEIVYTAHLFNILAKLGNRKIQVQRHSRPVNVGKLKMTCVCENSSSKAPLLLNSRKNSIVRTVRSVRD